ncbi:MAG TPA: Rossmann-like and DUF2520 domain-containing protein [Longimicrobiales bacterium]|nr:Rossmann-like and DUF2520 domain-containing protein [Longimicrobiales bacterium]
MNDRLVVVGPGRMGLALGSALRAARGVEHITFFGRGIEPPPHPLFEPVPDGPEWEAPPPVEYRMIPATIPQGTTLLLLAVPDSALAEVAYEVTRFGPAPPGCAALHLSGALSTDVLAPLHHAGYTTGSLHPLQAVADPWLAGERLHGITFALAGEPAAIAAGRRIASALAGTTLVIAPALRPLYHAAAVLASNYLVAVVGAAVRVLVQAGVPEEEALPALLPLLRGTLENVAQLGVPAALTGPIARGDADTLRLHLARLSARERTLYCALGLELLELARAAGLAPERAEEIEALLTSG